MSSVITSKHNKLCKLIRSLHVAKYRRRLGMFVAEGRNAVQAAISNGWEIRHLVAAQQDCSFWQDMFVQNGHKSDVISGTDDQLLAAISSTKTSQDVIAVVAHKSTFDPQLWQRAKVLLVLDGVSDPGNVGTLIRAACASGADGVILTEDCADPFSPKVIRSSAGGVLQCPILQVSAAEMLQTAQCHHWTLVAADAHQGENCFAHQWPQKVLLVLGNEARGVSKVLLESAQKVTIPMSGTMESLNVAMAGTVLLFAVLRQEE